MKKCVPVKSPYESYRRCDMCGKRYYRANRIRLWVKTNYGHRAGWAKADQRICCDCMNARQAQQVLLDIHPTFLKHA